MWKFKEFRKVLDGLTAASSSAASSASSQPGAREVDIPETLQSEHFQLCKVTSAVYCHHLLQEALPRVCAIQLLHHPSSSPVCVHVCGLRLLCGILRCSCPRVA